MPPFSELGLGIFLVLLGFLGLFCRELASCFKGQCHAVFEVAGVSRGHRLLKFDFWNLLIVVWKILNASTAHAWNLTGIPKIARFQKNCLFQTKILSTFLAAPSYLHLPHLSNSPYHNFAKTQVNLHPRRRLGCVKYWCRAPSFRDPYFYIYIYIDTYIYIYFNLYKHIYIYIYSY